MNVAQPILQMTVHSFCLFDAVVVYAKALDAVLREGGTEYDGTAIVHKIRGSSYESKIQLFGHLRRIKVSAHLCTLMKKKLNEPMNSSVMGLHWKCLVKSVRHR